MTMITKRMKKIRETVPSVVTLDVLNAFETLKKLSTVKFVESIDVSVNLGVDPKKSDQVVRGAVVLPNGTGKTMRVAVITQAANAKAAQDAGADLVGYEDLAESIKGGKFDFDVLIATPDAMPLVGKLGPVLGPRGLMPNPKVGTVTTDVASAVKNAKAGQVQYRTEKSGIVHCRIGSVKFTAEALKENLVTLINALKKSKPSSSKGVYLKKISVSSTMGPGILIDRTSLETVK